MDDILYSPIGKSKTKTLHPNWRKVPIIIHILDPALLDGTNAITWQSAPIATGIHYAYPQSCDIGALENEIYQILEWALNRSPPEMPYGIHWPIRSVSSPHTGSSLYYDGGARSKLLAIGINPISYYAGVGQIIWDQLFRGNNAFGIIVDGPAPSQNTIDPDFLDMTK